MQALVQQLRDQHHALLLHHSQHRRVRAVGFVIVMDTMQILGVSDHVHPAHLLMLTQWHRLRPSSSVTSFTRCFCTRSARQVWGTSSIRRCQMEQPQGNKTGFCMEMQKWIGCTSTNLRS